MQGGPEAHGPAYADMVMPDELGCLPFSASGGALLFYLLSRLCERTSVVITTSLSFSECASYEAEGSRVTSGRLLRATTVAPKPSSTRASVCGSGTAPATSPERTARAYKLLPSP